MSIFKSNLKPNEVFNPRGKYNPQIYVPRPSYEDKFKYGLNCEMCILIHGLSGTGKTWLTRRVLEENNIYYKIVNLAHASNQGSIYTCFKNMLAREHWTIRTNYTEKKAASIGIMGTANGQLETTKSFDTGVDYFMEFLKFMTHHAREKNQTRYIVFENMETILDKKNIISELANLITLIDDEEVNAHKTKFIIIGATESIHEYFNNVLNINTIDNRIYELPEVSTLTTLQAQQLIGGGFNKLELSFVSDELKNECIEKFIRVTGGIPQRIHELCLNFSLSCMKQDSAITNKDIDNAIKDWVMTSLNKNYCYISKLLILNSKSNELYRNQLLFLIAQKDTLYFTNNDIDKDFEIEFGKSSKKHRTSTRVLNELCSQNPPLLRKTAEEYNEYSFIDFKCALCLRAILHKDGEFIRKNDIYDI